MGIFIAMLVHQSAYRRWGGQTDGALKPKTHESMSTYLSFNQYQVRMSVRSCASAFVAAFVRKCVVFLCVRVSTHMHERVLTCINIFYSGNMIP